MRYEVELGGTVRTVDVERAESGWVVRIDGGPPRAFSGRSIGSSEWFLSEGNAGGRIGIHLDGDRADLQIDGWDVRGHVVDPRRARVDLTAGAGAGAVTSPMPGVVVRVLVQPGDAVSEGQPVVVVEAMKMENEYPAPVTGVVESVVVEPGQAVDADALLLTVSASEEDDR